MVIETEEKPEAFSTSLYVTDRKAFEECKRLLKLQGRSLSEEIMEFVLRRRDELKGNGSTESSGDSVRRFEELKAQHFQLGQKTDKLKAFLQEKKVYDAGLERFGRVLGYDADKSSWTMDECVTVIEKFVRHSSDDDWKRAETRLLVSWKVGGVVHTFLDYLECVRERKRVERKLLELRADPVELARLDELERLEEEQRKKKTELENQRGIEEEQKQKNGAIFSDDTMEDSDEDSDIPEDDEEEEEEGEDD